jgi:hypothetical protein
MIDSSARWRQCARKSRQIADQSRDPLITKTMVDIALSYERLAIHADAQVTYRLQAPVAKRRSTRKASTSTIATYATVDDLDREPVAQP